MTRQGAKRKATDEKGVYELVSEEKLTKTPKGKITPDVCYYIAYKFEGKLIWEKIGWMSDGYGIKVAAAKRADRLHSIRHGEELPQQKAKAPLFKDVMDKYLIWADTNKANGRTTDNYLYQGQKGETGHLKHLDDKRMDEIHPFELEKLKKEILDTGLAPATAKHILVLIGEVYNKAITWGLYNGENPVKKVKMPVLQNKRERFLSYDEANILVANLNKLSSQLQDICLLALYCGLRAREILNLRGQDLDFESNLIHIADPKNKHPRKVHITAKALEILLARKPESPSQAVFINRKGEKIASVSKAFESIIDELGCNSGITDDEANILVANLNKKSSQLHDICLLSLYCGLRAGEIFNLRGQDLDFENNLIHIADPKNKHPRKAYMTAKVRGILLARKPESPGQLVFKSREKKKNKDISTTPDEKITSVSRTFERIIDELGFNSGITDPRQKIVFHSLRHTFASWLALQGEPIQVIGELLGHRTLTMTQRYAHLTGDHKRRAAEKLEACFNAVQQSKKTIKKVDSTQKMVYGENK
ncbi:MAG: tyrosine-type recombinase/integrase [Syntrophus sp. (in: bacteria)]